MNSRAVSVTSAPPLRARRLRTSRGVLHGSVTDVRHLSSQAHGGLIGTRDIHEHELLPQPAVITELPPEWVAAPSGRTVLDPSSAKAALRRAKLAYTTRGVGFDAVGGILAGDDVRPESGDVVLATVTAIGQHKRIELHDGRRATLFPGDEVVVCFGNRYAPDQFEARVPERLQPCDLVAAGGVASQVRARHTSMGAPTAIAPVGLLAYEDGGRINLRDWALPRAEPQPDRPATIAVLGTSMNAGKTTSAAHLIYGLASSGRHVAAAKVTGTGAGGDVWLMQDSGASPVLDFTHAGHASTAGLVLEEVEDILLCLTAELAASGAEAIVLEIADGLFQAETAALVASQRFAEAVDGVLFAGSDALGVALGTRRLTDLGLPVVGVTGAVTASPLATREAATASGLPVLDLDALRDPATAGALLMQQSLAA